MQELQNVIVNVFELTKRNWLERQDGLKEGNSNKINTFKRE